jgi:hypothetical protein
MEFRPAKSRATMTDQEQHLNRVTYFNARYELANRVPFVADTRIQLRDYEDEAMRRCRYCRRGRPDATFRKDAHAFPDFLGNLSVFSMNECDGCNEYFGIGCEDHLSKQTLLARTLAGIPRKKGKESTFKSNDGTLRIDSNGLNVNIQVPSPNSGDDLLIDGKLPDQIPLSGDTASQPYVPIQAAMALVKIACSVAPAEDLDQCRGATEWIRGRQAVHFSQFPVSFAFTPGSFDERVSQVIILRRKEEGPEPYLWCVVQFRNFRFQVFVPFCAADAGWFGKHGPEVAVFEHYPSLFGPDWPLGPTTFSWDNWAGTIPVRTGVQVSHKVVQVIKSVRPR